MRRLALAAGLVTSVLALAARPALADPGDLDPGFGGTGHVAAVVAGNQDGVDVAVRPSGRVIVVSAGGTVAQFLANGDPDPDFGTGGGVPAPGGISIQAMTLDAAGNLVLAGSQGGDVFVERLLGNGDPGPAFHGTGALTTHLSRAAYAASVAVGPAGRIVVVGGVGSQPSRFLAIRYLPGGGLDPAFGGDGTVSSVILGEDFAEDVAIGDDGSV